MKLQEFEFKAKEAEVKINIIVKCVYFWEFSSFVNLLLLFF